MEEEISLKEIVLKLKEFWEELWSKKYWVIAITCTISLLFGLRAFMKPTLYRAELSFMVDDDEGGGMAGLGAVLGQFGLGGGGGKYNSERILEIARSNRIVQQALMDTAIIDGKADLIANHIIDIYNYHEIWEEDTALFNFKFKSRRNEDLKTNRVMKGLISKFIGSPENPSEYTLATISFNEESTIIDIKTKSENEELSIALASSWYDKLSIFYIKKSVEPQQITYEQLSHRADSIYRLLTESESGLASDVEKRGLIRATDNLSQGRSTRNVRLYSTMYAEIIKNKETADFILKSETPYFQILDTPSQPLKKENGSLLIGLLLGAIIGGALATGGVIGTYYVRQKMYEVFDSEE